ncbi:MAG: hypothetical protein FJZ62_01475 [Chlamydiae bacterium]|nr:hypothetical protein [Chlamydiota bacterium]
MNIQLPQIVFPENILTRMEAKLKEVESTVTFGGMHAAQKDQEKKTLRNLTQAAHLILESNHANRDEVSIDEYFAKLHLAFESLASNHGLCREDSSRMAEGKKQTFLERAESIKMEIREGKYPIKKISELANRLFMRFKDGMAVCVMAPEEKNLIVFTPAKMKQIERKRALSVASDAQSLPPSGCVFPSLDLEAGRQTPDTARLTQRAGYLHSSGNPSLSDREFSPAPLIGLNPLDQSLGKMMGELKESNL